MAAGKGPEVNESTWTLPREEEFYEVLTEVRCKAASESITKTYLGSDHARGILVLNPQCQPSLDRFVKLVGQQQHQSHDYRLFKSPELGGDSKDAIMILEAVTERDMEPSLGRIGGDMRVLDHDGENAPLLGRNLQDNVHARDPVPEKFHLAEFLPEGEGDQEQVQKLGIGQRNGDKPLLFVLLRCARDQTQEGEWLIADEDNFNRVVQQVVSKLAANDPAEIKNSTMAWADPRSGTLALKPDSRSAVKAFQQLIRQQTEDEVYEYETYLQDPPVEMTKVVVLLKKELKTVEPQRIAPTLFRVNSNLRGCLRLLKCMHYQEEDFDMDGASQEGWRLFQYEADDTFIHSLNSCYPDYKLMLGSSEVTIRRWCGHRA